MCAFNNYNLPSNISATINHGIGPKPISKKNTKALTAKTANILFTRPNRATTTTIQDKNIPAEEHKINVLRPVLSMTRRATYVAITLFYFCYKKGRNKDEKKAFSIHFVSKQV